MDWRVIVLDEERFCVVGTLDLTFDECKLLDDRRGPGVVRIPHRRIPIAVRYDSVVSLDTEYSFQMVRGERFYRRRGEREQSMLHVLVRDDKELDGLRRTGRFREWDADLRQVKTLD